MSSTSGSRSQPSPSGALGAHVGLVAAVPDRQLVAPPELARDAPGPDVLEPVEVDAGPRVLGVEGDPAVLDHLDRGTRQLVHVAEPLQRDQRLDAAARAVRVRHVVLVGLGARDQPLVAQCRDHVGARLVRLHPAEALRRSVGHAAVLADHGDLVEALPAADLEVARVVPRRDLERAGSELGIDVLVGDDRQPSPDERQDRRLADQTGVALVLRVHRDRRVREHRLGAHRRDRHRARTGLERVIDHVQRVLDGALLHLEVGYRRAQAGIPIDQIVIAVDEALLVEPHEDVRDGAHVVVVHREALVRVVERRAQRPELALDRVAVLLPPMPDPPDELLAADLLAARALALQQLLDLALCRDAGVVRPEDPLGPAPPHPRHPDARVLDRGVQRVAHVQAAGDVRWRHGDRVVLFRAPLRGRG